MKPDWSESPGWARWLVVDSDSEFWWFEDEPSVDDEGFWHCVTGNIEWAARNYEGPKKWGRP